MKIVGLLSFYDESPAWLGAIVAGLKGFVDHIVVADGAYGLYPEARERPCSGFEQTEAIMLAAETAKIGCTIHRLPVPWRGNEVEKRTFLFRASELVAEPWHDWLFMFDADDFVSRVPADLKQRLEQTGLDAGESKLWWRDDWEAQPSVARVAREMELPVVSWAPLRNFFRAIPGLRCEYAHMVYCYDNPDGERVFLRGREDVHKLDAVVDLTDFHVEHRHNWRGLHRQKQSDEYYQLRDRCGAEDIPEDYWITSTREAATAA